MTTLDDLVASGGLRSSVSITGLTTYKLGGPARYYLEAEDEAQLVSIGEALEDEPVLVLGRGSNLIVSDDGFPGLVVHLGAGFVRTDLDEHGTVTSGAATSLPALARTCARAGRGGLEFFIGIPGSVGGGVRMNAGCHGSETKDRLESARVIDLRRGEVGDRKPDDLQMTYRHTNLRADEIVISAVFSSELREPAEIEETMREITRWRREHQPGGTFNAGSVFKNPPGDSAGRIIDSLGLKGTRIGGAHVSSKHANFFIADDGVCAQDVYDLVWAVRRRVGIELDIWLQPEVQFAGSFRPSPDEGAR
ncbi:MAG: UDP-N-acetylmuramate dehydrogenase [Acidimicrobiia bacterium]|nr:UDP-N-acetylmuramate dehydrogenase [Acidimicrobiia bacterium]MDH3396410.1 UDP-N-acetylmuramate dehydrogenase [Acidimicrobiia bacterium]